MSHGLGELSATIRLWPHKLRGEGHYVAVLRKEGTLADGGSGLLKNGYENGITAGDSKSAAAGIPEYLAFAGETFAGDALEKYAGRECRYLKFGEQLYRIPEGMPSVKGLKVLRPGLHLGTAKKGDLSLHTHLRSHFMRRMFYIRWILPSARQGDPADT